MTADRIAYAAGTLLGLALIAVAAWRELQQRRLERKHGEFANLCKSPVCANCDEANHG